MGAAARTAADRSAIARPPLTPSASDRGAVSRFVQPHLEIAGQRSCASLCVGSAVRGRVIATLRVQRSLSDPFTRMQARALVSLRHGYFETPLCGQRTMRAVPEETCIEPSFRRRDTDLRRIPGAGVIPTLRGNHASAGAPTPRTAATCASCAAARSTVQARRGCCATTMATAAMTIAMPAI